MCVCVYMCVHNVVCNQGMQVMATPTYPHVVRTMVEGVAKAVDSWWPLAYYPPIEGSQISDHP